VRDLIYSSLLRSMSPEHKFSSAAKLCGEVLAGVADGLLPLAECEEVLRDALCLLASKDIKVRHSTRSALTILFTQTAVQHFTPLLHTLHVGIIPCMGLQPIRPCHR
jgi:hypothetical protein